MKEYRESVKVYTQEEGEHTCLLYTIFHQSAREMLERIAHMLYAERYSIICNDRNLATDLPLLGAESHARSLNYQYQILAETQFGASLASNTTYPFTMANTPEGEEHTTLPFILNGIHEYLLNCTIDPQYTTESERLKRLDNWMSTLNEQWHIASQDVNGCSMLSRSEHLEWVSLMRFARQNTGSTQNHGLARKMGSVYACSLTCLSLSAHLMRLSHEAQTMMYVLPKPSEEHWLKRLRCAAQFSALKCAHTMISMAKEGLPPDAIHRELLAWSKLSSTYPTPTPFERTARYSSLIVLN